MDPAFKTAFAIAGGWIVAALIGHFTVPSVLNCLEASMLRGWNGTIKPPSWIPQDIWKGVWPRQGGSTYLGFFEVSIFYASFISDGWPLMAAWLAFKVACQWESWNHSSGMIEVTKELAQKDPVAGAADLLSVNRWVAVRYMSFLVGTAANIVIALAVAAALRAVLKSLEPGISV